MKGCIQLKQEASLSGADTEPNNYSSAMRCNLELGSLLLGQPTVVVLFPLKIDLVT